MTPVANEERFVKPAAPPETPRPEIVNAYYPTPHNQEILPAHLDADLERMVSLGTTAISICIQEGQMLNWAQGRLHSFIARARAHGLQVFAVPNRWCGLTAGWLDGYSEWTLRHHHTLFAREKVKGYFGASDPAHPEVRRHFEENLRLLLDRFDIAGVIWDEPRPALPAVIEFLDEMTAFARSLRPDLVAGLFLESTDARKLGAALAATRHITYLGADGHVRRAHHRMHRMKTTIFETHELLYPRLVKAGKKTLFLLEAQRHRDEDLPHYVESAQAAFSLPMDHLMYYYSAHEMNAENGRRFNRVTWLQVALRARGSLAGMA